MKLDGFYEAIKSGKLKPGVQVRLTTAQVGLDSGKHKVKKVWEKGKGVDLEGGKGIVYFDEIELI